MPKKNWPFAVCMCLYFSAFSQSLNTDDVYNLQAVIYVFLSDKDNIPTEKFDRPSEFVVCLLQVDSNGKVNSIHLFADDKNKAATFRYLSLLTPAVFKDWKSEKCRGKTIMIPVVSFSEGKGPEYMRGLIDYRNFYFQPNPVISEIDKLVIISPLQYRTPYSDPEEPPIIATRFDSTKKN